MSKVFIQLKYENVKKKKKKKKWTYCLEKQAKQVYLSIQNV